MKKIILGIFAVFLTASTVFGQAKKTNNNDCTK